MKLELRWVAVVLTGALAAACGSTTGDGDGDGDGGVGGHGGEPASGGSEAASGGKTSSGGSDGGGLGGFGGEPSVEVCQPEGLSAHYKADGDVLEEVSGEQGQLIGSAVADAEGVFGEAFGFLGEGAHYVEGAEIDGDDLGTSDFSIAFWVKTTTTNMQILLDKRVFAEQGAINGYHVYLYGGAPGLQIADGLYDNYTSDPTTAGVADGNWHQVVISVDRDQTDGLNVYVDGALADTLNPTAHQASTDNASPLIIGGHVQALEQPSFFGSIDELQLYKRALTADDAAYLVDHAMLEADCR